jgi:hypothetical protein
VSMIGEGELSTCRRPHHDLRGRAEGGCGGGAAREPMLTALSARADSENLGAREKPREQRPRTAWAGA